MKIKSLKVGSLTVEIHTDEEAESPRRAFDNAGTMVCWHRDYDLGDKHTFSSPENFLEWWKENGTGGVLLPLYLYDHSGISMRVGRSFADVDPGEWDSGQVGFIYATKETILKEWGTLDEKKAKACLEGEVEIYDQYLTHDVYGYVVKGPNGESLDSVWGYYGREDVEAEGKMAAENCLEEMKEGEKTVNESFAL